MDFVIAAVEGFNFHTGFVIRELTLLFPDNSEQHFQFRNPETVYLDDRDKRTAKFAKRHLHGFSATDDGTCCLPYSIYPQILKAVENCRIYVAGQIARRFFMKNLPYTPIIDVYSSWDFMKYPIELENPQCFFLHRFRYCSLAKARYLKERLTGYTL